MLKFTKVALLGAVLTVGLSASDFLAKATNGAVSDASIGVKQLAIDDMEKVVGGYYITGIYINDQEIGVAAVPYETELGVVRNADGSVNIDASQNSDFGLCQMGESQCYYNNQTKSYLQYNRNRFIELVKGLQGSYSVWAHGLAYTVKREVKVSNMGNRYVVFKYGVGAYNRLNKTFHRIESSDTLNNNTIVRELRDAFKERIEHALGGWNAN